MKYTEKAPTYSLSVKILRRGLSDEEFAELVHTYVLAKEKYGGKCYVPTASHIKLYKAYMKNSITMAECIKEMGVKASHTVQSRFFVIFRDHADKIK